MNSILLHPLRAAFFTSLLLASSLAADSGGAPASAETTEYGPAKGTLIIIGGGNDAGTGITETFIQRAGGLDAKLVVVPTANGNRNPDGSIIQYKEEQVVAYWKRLGMKNVRMLHTHDPKIADTEEFVKPLREADAVWFDGGRQWNIVDSYKDTLTYREFHKVLERGGVIAGSSAGATIQGDYLVRGAIAGPDIVMTPEPEHEHGFNFLRKSAIDQHINTRGRWDDLIPVVKKYPNLLGIGLSEGTAIIVNGDRFEVKGKWKVAIHDNTRIYQPWEKPYYVLSSGDVYNMKTRKVEKYSIGAEPRPPVLRPRPVSAEPVSGTKIDDGKAFQGVWKPMQAVLGGAPLPEPVVKGITLKISGDTYEVAIEGEAHADRGTSKYDNTTTPKRLTINSTDGPNKGKTLLAIYEFPDADTLRVCYDLSGAKYPTEFKSESGTKDYLATYKRKKE